MTVIHNVALASFNYDYTVQLLLSQHFGYNGKCPTGQWAGLLANGSGWGDKSGWLQATLSTGTYEFYAVFCPTGKEYVPTKNNGCPKTTAGTNPCNAANGNKYQRETDYIGAGGYPLKFERVYNSTEPISSSVGSHWNSNYDQTVQSITTGIYTSAKVIRSDGNQYSFDFANTNSAQSDADVVGQLIKSGIDASGYPTGWTYINEQDETETYNAAGKLISITNRAGQSQTLTYSDGTAGANGGYVLDTTGTPTTTVLPAGRLIRVADSAGRVLQFGYDTAGRITRVTDPGGGVYAYTYSGPLATDNLNSVTYPDGSTRTYLYGETANVSATPNAGVSYAHALTGIIDENSSRYAGWTYDAAGRATSSERGAPGGGIGKVSLAYGPTDANGNRTTSVTDANGVTRDYSFATSLGVVRNTGVTGQPCNGCNATLTYDANGNISSRTDFNGNKICYSYDLTRNLETTRLEGMSPGTSCPTDLTAYAPSTTAGSAERKITTQWHASLRLPLAIAEPLRITNYTYDAKGSLLGRAIQPTTDATGGAGVTAAANGTARTTTYTYNTAGQVLTIDGPRTDVTDVTNYGYDAQGNLVSV
ncbi:MAG TPA: DUF6531 domain-containing protein, partial [Gallionella sp.]|nr:DUF6531 domain-containing protein [Gallionella sp.]